METTEPAGDVLVLNGHTGEVHPVVFSPDGETILTGGSDGKLFLWNSETGALTRQFEQTSGNLLAAAFAPEVARTLGVRVGLMLTVGWGLAAGVGSLAGLLATPPFLFPNVLDGVFVYALTAAVLGGLDNPLGTIAGGFVLGVGLSYVSGYLGPELVTIAALAILVVVLTLRPSGLFGRAKVRRVGPCARNSRKPRSKRRSRAGYCRPC